MFIYSVWCLYMGVWGVESSPLHVKALVSIGQSGFGYVLASWVEKRGLPSVESECPVRRDVFLAMKGVGQSSAEWPLVYFYFVPWWWPVVVGRSCRMVVCFFHRSMFDVQRVRKSAEWLLFLVFKVQCSMGVGTSGQAEWLSLLLSPNWCRVSLMLLLFFFVLLVGKYLCYIIMSCLFIIY